MSILPIKRRFDTSPIAADTDIFSDDISVDNRSGLRITISLDSSSVVYLTETSNNTTEKYALNAGATLDAGDLYSFDVPIRDDGTYNMQLNSQSGIKVVNVDEVTGGII